MNARVELQLSKDADGFHIDGEREFDFQSGVEYIVNSDSDIWVSWNETDEYESVVDVQEGIARVFNLTCPDHHRYVSDALMYYVRFNKIVDLTGIPIGLWDREIEDDVIKQEHLTDLVSEYESNTILASRRYVSNGTFEELFGLEQEDWISPEILELPTNGERDFEFQKSERYLAVIDDGVRIDPDLYRATFIGSDERNKIIFNDKFTKPILVKTDLCHNVRSNGSKRIRIIVREGDERKFFFNSVDRSNPVSFVGRGTNTFRNQVAIRNQFDDLIFSKYPEIYELVNSYYKFESMNGSPTSFLRNMDEYFDIDRMPMELLRDRVKIVFEAFDSVAVDKRLFAKRLIDFFKSKGVVASYKWLSNAFFKEEAEVVRFSDEVIRLSSTVSTTNLFVTLLRDDVMRLIETGESVVLGTDSVDPDEVAQSLVGVTFQGRSTSSIAVVEQVEVKEIQRVKFYVLRCTVKNGVFEDREFLDINRISGAVCINKLTTESEFFGINDVDIEDGSYGYSIGDSLEAVSSTGKGFKAEVVNVGPNGSIKNVKIQESGWFYNPAVDKIDVVNDKKVPQIKFDPSMIQDARLIRSGNYGYSYLDGKVIDSNFVGTSLMLAGYSINNGDYIFGRPVATVRYRNSVYFFGKGKDNRSIYVINDQDLATKLDIQFDSDIVNVLASDRTVYIILNSSMMSMSIEDAFIPKPIVKTIPLISASGVVKTIFVVENKLYGITPTTIVQFNTAGDVVETLPVPRAYDFSMYTKVGDVDTLYLGLKGNLYAYQWYSGERKAKLVPKTGIMFESREDSESFSNVLSGHNKIGDSYLYQDFSLGIQLGQTTDSYMKNFDDLVNPAGYKVFGIHVVKPGDDTLYSGVLKPK